MSLVGADPAPALVILGLVPICAANACRQWGQARG